MQMNRRRVIQTAFALGACTVTRSWAMTSAQFDGFTIDSLSDGRLVLPLSMLTPDSVDPSQIAPILAEAGISGDSFNSPVNVTLLRRDDRLILFDAGSGPDFMPTAGDLPDALAALGLAPDQITDVIFTHAHPDHIWGVLDDFDEPLFVNARHMIGRAEHDYWADPETVDRIDPARQSFAAGAKRRLDALAGILELFEAGDEVLPGLHAVATPGHTPGHTSFDIAGQVFVTGDALTNAHLAMRRPDLPSGSDQDPELGIETRVSLLNDLADSGHMIVGYHLPDGGMGKVLRDGDAFRFQPG